jgi:hypothetical protein
MIKWFTSTSVNGKLVGLSYHHDDVDNYAVDDDYGEFCLTIDP